MVAISALITLVMFAGCVVMWVGVPLAWLWIGSQLQSSASLGTGLAVAMIGSIATIIGVVYVLSWLDRQHAELRHRRMLAEGTVEVDEDGDEEEPRGVLEPMLVGSAAVAVLLFGIWFFGFAGASPVPLNIGY